MSEENLYTFENEAYRKTYWHTCSHVMAQAVKRLYPQVKLAIGPSIDSGWYYDFDADFSFTQEHLDAIEAEMKKICKEKLPLVRSEKPRAEAVAYMESLGEPYKVELINDLPEDAVISFYTQGEFTDLCAGPHLDSTGRIKANAFKLTQCCGAYWRGDSKRKMLQRIYGIAEGADEYIPKPFNIDFLKIRIINIIAERQKMKEIYMKNLQAGTMDNVEVCKLMKVDELFRDKLLSIVDTQYENSDFSIEDLSEHLGLSRVHLYRKMKTLFGVSPTDYLRNYRLNKAMLLLKSRKYNISEVAYMTGFTSPAYFTKCFRTLYKVTPSEAMTT